MRRRTIILLLLFFSQTLAWAHGSSYGAFPIDNINFDHIAAMAEKISSFESRVTGYPGYYRTLTYIERLAANFANKRGLDIIKQNFTVLVPLEIESYLVVGNTKYRAYAMWPNLVHTCKTVKPISGKFVYAKGGGIEEINGLPLNGSIAFLDFNSGYNWLRIASLGAKAIVFVEPNSTNTYESLTKFIEVPINIPRLYVRKDTFEEILRINPEEVSVFLNMEFREVNATNIVVEVPGSNENLRNEIIVVATYLDSFSPVPMLSPGFSEAISTAYLLNLLEILAENPTERTVWIVFLSGHWQALAGARYFVEKFFLNEGRRIVAFIGLDLSNDKGKLGLMYKGYFYEFYAPNVERWIFWLKNKIFGDGGYLDKLSELSDFEYRELIVDALVKNYGWWGQMYGPYILDSEPFVVAHGLGFTIADQIEFPTLKLTPIDEVRNLDRENLLRKLEIATAIIYGLANEPDYISWSDISPERIKWSAGGADVAGFITMEGEVLVYNVSSGWYTALGNAIVIVSRYGLDYLEFPFTRIYVKSNENGKFRVLGLGHGSAVGWYYVEAYVLDNTTGDIIYAPDYGVYGYRQLSFAYSPDSHPVKASTVVFRCATINIFDLVDPLGLRRTVYYDRRFMKTYTRFTGGTIYHLWLNLGSSLSILDKSTLSEYIRWGACVHRGIGAASIFVPLNSTTVILFKIGQPAATVGILANASREYPNGVGFKCQAKSISVKFSSFIFARDLYLVALKRYSILKENGIRDPLAEKYLDLAGLYLADIKREIKENNYGYAYTLSIIAWNTSLKAYRRIMGMISDTMTVNLMYFLLTVLFIFFLDLILFKKRTIKEIAFIAGATAGLILIYYLIHPAPKISQSFIISPLSVTLEILFLFVAVLFLRNFSLIIKEAAKRVSGTHRIEEDFFALASLSFKYSIENVMRRKIRAMLIMINLTTIMFAMVALTSAYPSQMTVEGYVGGSAIYEGVMISYGFENTPANVIDYDLSKAILPLLRGLDYKISYRIWLYPQSYRGSSVFILATYNGRTYKFKSILGLSPDEIELRSGIKDMMIGRWFEHYDEYVCIISSSAAEKLGINIYDKLSLGGLNLTVIGILDSSAIEYLKDLDGSYIVPVDPDDVVSLKVGIVSEEVRKPVSLDEIIIVPDRLALKLGGYVSSIAVKVDYEHALNIARNLSLVLEGPAIYLSDGSRVVTVSVISGLEIYGWNYLLIPLIIGSFTVVISIMGNIRERKSEIDVYSAIGLPPSGIVVMFMTEALIYGVIAAVIGYIAGVATNRILVGRGLLPPSFMINVSSSFMIIAFVIIMLSTILSALFPSLSASKMVTPSLRRKWRATKPVGIRWEVPLPFTASSIAEARGMLRYLAEFLGYHKIETPDPFFVDELKVDLDNLRIDAKMTLKPLESGVKQSFVLSARRFGGRYTFAVSITRLSGSKEIWRTVNYKVIDAVRKQFLLWRSLPEEEALKYIRGEKHV